MRFFVSFLCVLCSIVVRLFFVVRSYIAKSLPAAYTICIYPVKPPMDMLLTDDQLLQLLQDTFGSEVRLVNSQVGKRAHDYLVLIAQLERPALKVVIKIAGPEAPLASQFERTAMLQDLVRRETNIPMPETHAVNMSFERWPWRYVIKTFLEGEMWVAVRDQLTEQERSAAFRQLGHAVAQLHQIGFPAYGELRADGSVQAEPDYLTAFSGRARRSIISDHLFASFLEALERRGGLFVGVAQPVLCHEDLHGYNILFERDKNSWRLATIIDFDKAWAGHNQIDLARMDIWKGMTSRAFWEAYHEIHPVDPLYAERRPLYQLLWCFEYAENTAEHLADTQRLCNELGVKFEGRFE